MTAEIYLNLCRSQILHPNLPKTRFLQIMKSRLPKNNKRTRHLLIELALRNGAIQDHSAKKHPAKFNVSILSGMRFSPNSPCGIITEEGSA